MFLPTLNLNHFFAAWTNNSLLSVICLQVLEAVLLSGCPSSCYKVYLGHISFERVEFTRSFSSFWCYVSLKSSSLFFDGPSCDKLIFLPHMTSRADLCQQWNFLLWMCQARHNVHLGYSPSQMQTQACSVNWAGQKSLSSKPEAGLSCYQPIDAFRKAKQNLNSFYSP